MISDPLDPLRVANRSGGGLFINSYSDATTEIRNTTISGNWAEGNGGGIMVRDKDFAGQAFGGGSVAIRHCTITDNRADSDNDGIGSGGVIYTGTTLTRIETDHTIVALNFWKTGSDTARDDISNVESFVDRFGFPTSNPITTSWSLIGDGTGATVTPVAGSTNYIGNSSGIIDPHLGALADNGGATQTHALLPGSPAIDAGNPAAVPGVGGVPQYDQRGVGFSRRVDVPSVNGATPIVDIGAYEYLVGDYNRDGTVDCHDYMLWRSLFNTYVTNPYDGPDGNGDGHIDAADYVIWAHAFDADNTYTLGDYNRNGSVDAGDYNVWRSSFGLSGLNLAADGNCNGVVDTADYIIWRDRFKSMIGVAKFGILDDAFGPDVPPEVVGFALLGPTTLESYDFSAVAGSGDQLRSVSLSTVTAVSITFNRAVSLTQGALQLINLDGSVPSISNFEYDADSQTATWTFTSALVDGRYLVRLADSIHDASNRALDGEFTNPWSLTQTETSVFSSGDGTAGGEFRFRFTVLAGDTDHDNIVGATNYQNWKSYEPGRAYVSTTADDYDADVSFGDFSLREAINYANTAGEPTTIELPAGRYVLSRAGTESNDTAYNDLDVSGNVTILGAGPGLSVITTAFSGAPSEEIRVFQVAGPAARLKLMGVTLAGTWAYSQNGGAAALVQGGATLEMDECAVVNNSAYYAGVGVRSMGSHVTIVRSVFTGNFDYSDGAVYASDTPTNAGSLTIGESIFALNGTYSTIRNVKATAAVVKTNLGYNLFDNANGGFFNVVAGTGDHLGTAQYVVTSIADTFDHSNDSESLSIREAVDKANQAAGTQEIWIPAWKFVLTRDRGSSTTDTDTTIGDIEVKDSIVLRGVAGGTSVAWKAGVNDRVFELLGDYSGNNSVDVADYAVWRDQDGSSGEYEEFVADGDDDGDVDSADYDIWRQGSGFTLEMIDVAT